MSNTVRGGMYAICPCCGGVAFQEDMVEHEEAAVRVCRDCLHTSHICEHCGGIAPESQMVGTVDDGYVCRDCQSEYWLCDYCNRWTPAIVSDDNITLCESCYDDYYFTCSNCDRICHNDYYGRDGICEDCLPEEDDYYDDSRELHDYGYKPRPVFHKTEKDGVGIPYYGIEAEVECCGNDIPDMENGYWYLKHDGSLNNGFEVVSHPASWNWLCENENRWNALFDLRHEGYRSYNTETCGMHVHMSRNAFSAFHLYKFLAFFYGNPRFIRAISQRKPDDLERWASLTGDNDHQTLILKAKGDTGWRRYEAVNLTNKATIEIRIFKGTLNPASFWKNLEFLQSLYVWTQGIKAKDIKSITLPQYKAYVKAHREQYPNLAAWIQNRTNDTEED